MTSGCTKTWTVPSANTPELHSAPSLFSADNLKFQHPGSPLKSESGIIKSGKLSPFISMLVVHKGKEKALIAKKSVSLGLWTNQK